MWWELGCPCFRSGGGGLCSPNQHKVVSVPIQSRKETSFCSWYWAVVVQAHGSWESSARVMLKDGCCWALTDIDLSSFLFIERGDQGLTNCAAFRAACVAVPQVSETLRLRGCKWGYSGKGRAASKSCSSQSPTEHCWEGVSGHCQVFKYLWWWDVKDGGVCSSEEECTLLRFALCESWSLSYTK